MSTSLKPLSKSRSVSKSPPRAKKKIPHSPFAKSYNAFKSFGGRQYTGMKVGRGHKWYYDKGEWKETKITPELWRISYAVTKRRAGKAPEGSGVPVGTEYQWFIVAHQNVKKLNADDYTTSLSGFKYKLAHKRADKGKWNVTTVTQRKHLIAFLEQMIMHLQQRPLPIEFEYNGELYKGEGIPIEQTCEDKYCSELAVTLNDKYIGIIHCGKSGCRMNEVQDNKFIKAIGKAVEQ
jgi:hypothetical protein